MKSLFATTMRQIFVIYEAFSALWSYFGLSWASPGRSRGLFWSLLPSLGRSWGLFWSLLGSLLDALGLIFVEKLIFHDFDMSKSTVCDTCASDFRPKSQFATPVQKKTINRSLKTLIERSWKQTPRTSRATLYKTLILRIFTCPKHRLRRLCSGFWSESYEKRKLWKGCP